MIEMIVIVMMFLNDSVDRTILLSLQILDITVKWKELEETLVQWHHRLYNNVRMRRGGCISTT